MLPILTINYNNTTNILLQPQQYLRLYTSVQTTLWFSSIIDDNRNYLHSGFGGLTAKAAKVLKHGRMSRKTRKRGPKKLMMLFYIILGAFVTKC